MTSSDIIRRKIRWIENMHGTVLGCRKRTESAKDCMDCDRFHGYADDRGIRNVPITIKGSRRYMAKEVLCVKSKKSK